MGSQSWVFPCYTQTSHALFSRESQPRLFLAAPRACAGIKLAAVEFKCRMESSGVILAPSILGPNPGLFIVRIWQGVAEICLRIVLSVSLYTRRSLSVFS